MAYTAAIPQGIQLGPADNGSRTVAARTSNVHGTPLMAVLVPVVETPGGYAPARPDGTGAPVRTVARTFALPAGTADRFTIRAPLGVWDGVAGALLLLVYDEPGRDGPNWPLIFGDLEHLAVDVARAGTTAALPQPEDVQQDVAEALEAALAQPREALQPGIVGAP